MRIKELYQDEMGRWSDAALDVLESNRNYQPAPCDEYVNRSFMIIDISGPWSCQEDFIL
jgi:hypothetical protein